MGIRIRFVPLNARDFLLCGIQALFVALKLSGLVTWPWWQVMLPALIPLGIGALALCALLVLWILNNFVS